MIFQKLVVDANIFVAALLKNSVTRKILLNQKMPELITPDFVKIELEKYSKEFSKRLNVDETTLKSTIDALFDAAKIQIIPSANYCDFLNDALNYSPDKKDAPYFALALKFDCSIWSHDIALKKQTKVNVFTTREIQELLQIPSSHVNVQYPPQAGDKLPSAI